MVLASAPHKQLVQVTWRVVEDKGTDKAINAVLVSRDLCWAVAATAEGICVRQLDSGAKVLQLGEGSFQAAAVQGEAVLGVGQQGLLQFSLALGSKASSTAEQLSSSPASCLAQHQETYRTAFVIGR